MTKKLRAPKGSGYIVAAYYPGNLGRSINVLKFSRAKSKVYVGARIPRNTEGIFRGKKTDGYYMPFTEEGTVKQQGTHWYRAAWERSKPGVISIMTSAFERLGRQFEAENNVK